MPSSQYSREDFYRAFIGQKSQEYYLRQFAKFDSRGKAGATWHWPAFFATFYWLLYRKMWGTAVLYFFSPYIAILLLVIASLFVGKADGGLLVGVGWLVYIIAMFFFPALYANAFYYRHCKKKLVQVAASGHSEERQLGELTGRGGTSKLFLFLFIFVIIAIIGILAAIAIPAYQGYTVRAQTTRTVQMGKEMGSHVAEYYGKHHRVPETLAEAGYGQSLPDYVGAVKIDTQTGVISITMAKSMLTGKSLNMIPTLQAGGEMVWVCRSKDIPPRHLPKACQENPAK